MTVTTQSQIITRTIVRQEMIQTMQRDARLMSSDRVQSLGNSESNRIESFSCLVNSPSLLLQLGYNY